MLHFFFHLYVHVYVPSVQKKGEPSKSLINAIVFNEMVQNLAWMFIIHEENFCKNFKKIG